MDALVAKTESAGAKTVTLGVSDTVDSRAESCLRAARNLVPFVPSRVSASGRGRVRTLLLTKCESDQRCWLWEGDRGLRDQLTRRFYK